MAKERTVEDIRAEMADTRSDLKASFAGLRASMDPRNVLRHGVEDVKHFARSEFNDVKSQFVEPDGSLRTQRIVAVAGAAVGIIAFAVTVNALSKRRAVAPPRGRKAITAS